ncbi:MAG: ScpA family protein [Calditrichaceae bacterium]
MGYRVKIDVFEGPFDLLLFLIRKNEVDIYDIPIASITDQFLEYLEVINVMDLDVAGDFIEMVAILMHIKARMLLPQQFGDSDDELEDPRTELVEKLIEYKRFKEAALDMEELEEKRRLLYSRQYFKYLPRTEEISDEQYLENVTLFDLILAFKKAMDSMPKVQYHEVRKIEVTVEQQSEYILERAGRVKVLLFQDIMKEIREKIVLIVTFMALLDLIRSGKISVRQSDVFDDIRIQTKSEAA